jgi:hypothetical protein
MALDGDGKRRQRLVCDVAGGHHELVDGVVIWDRGGSREILDAKTAEVHRVMDLSWG